jgi:muramoyltetrapeptide carboxypeptidase
MEAGLRLLSDRYRPRFSDTLFASHRYLAGTDAQRLADLQEALDDDSRAIFCARGGYGAMRLLPALANRTAPNKLLVGFSDVTALHGWLQTRGVMSLHAPVLTQLGRQPHTAARLFHLLEEETPVAPLEGARTVVPGVAEGPLVGGNLAVLSRLIGTPFFPKLEGAILFLEDVTERPYRIDRMLTHLLLANAFQGVRGIALGTFTECEEKDAAFTSAEVIAEILRPLGVPCAADFPVGHSDPNQPIPLGAQVRLDAEAGRLEFLEPLVER